MSSFHPTPSTDASAGRLSAAEESKLDAAMRKADQILVASLQVDERRRRTRRLALLAFGSLIMITAGFVIFLSLFAAPSAQDVAKAEDLAGEGWKLWQQRSLVEAEAKFDEAVKADPTNVKAWNGLGWSQLNLGKMDDAEKAFAEVIKLDPNHAAALNGLGWIGFVKKDYAKAEEHWLKAAKDPQASAAFGGLATLYLVQGKFEDAEKWAQKAVNAGDANAQRLLDAAKAKKLDDNLRAQLQPKEAEAQKMSADTQQGWALIQSGKPKQAATAFEAALAANPEEFSALNGMGFALVNDNKPKEAIDYFKKCLSIEPNAAGPMNGLARCLKAEGKDDEAIALWKKMLDLYPGPNAAMHGLAQTYFEQEKYKDALPYLEALAKADPSSVELKTMLETAKAGAALK